MDTKTEQKTANEPQTWQLAPQGDKLPFTTSVWELFDKMEREAAQQRVDARLGLQSVKHDKEGE